MSHKKIKLVFINQLLSGVFGLHINIYASQNFKNPSFALEYQGPKEGYVSIVEARLLHDDFLTVDNIDAFLCGLVHTHTRECV